MLYTSLVQDNQQLFVTCNSMEIMHDFLQIRIDMEKKKKVENRFLSKSNIEDVGKLKHYLDLEYPEAVYLSAGFFDDEQSDSNRDSFYHNTIKKAADLGYPPAIYRYGAWIDFGDHFPEDKKAASDFFKKAARLGHAQSEWIYGVECFYGLGFQPHDSKTGLEYIYSAAYKKYCVAMEFLEEEHRNGSEFFEKDTPKADFFLNRLKDHDVIDLAH